MKLQKEYHNNFMFTLNILDKPSALMRLKFYYISSQKEWE